MNKYIALAFGMISMPVLASQGDFSWHGYVSQGDHAAGARRWQD